MKRPGGGFSSRVARGSTLIERQPAVRLPVGASPVQGCRPAQVPCWDQWLKLETLNRLLSALRYFIGAALPFIFFWVAVEKVFGGQSYRALACLGAAVLSFVVAVYWHRIIPARFRDEAKELQYLRTDQSFIWVPLPFTFSFIAVARFFDGGGGVSVGAAMAR